LGERTHIVRWYDDQLRQAFSQRDDPQQVLGLTIAGLLLAI
jgi:hypothetical protein